MFMTRPLRIDHDQKEFLILISNGKEDVLATIA